MIKLTFSLIKHMVVWLHLNQVCTGYFILLYSALILISHDSIVASFTLLMSAWAPSHKWMCTVPKKAAYSIETWVNAAERLQKHYLRCWVEIIKRIQKPFKNHIYRTVCMSAVLGVHVSVMRPNVDQVRRQE